MKIQPGTGLFKFILSVLFVLSSCLVVQAEQKREFSINVSVDGGQYKAARLKNLVRGAQMSISVHGFDQVDILILNQQDYQNYPSSKAPLFKGRSFDQLNFSVEIPASGTYFLVFDNRSSPQPVSLQLDIKATAPGASTTSNTNLQNSLDHLSENLHQLFIFNPVPIELRSCDTAGVFSVADGIVLCHEFITKLQSSLQDQQKTTDVLLFAIFHEFGHHLMLQWDYPFYDNEEIADEFATAILMMLRQDDRLQAASEFFVKNPSAREILVKTFKDDRHPLSVQRARNILNWMADANRIGRWQLFLIPHMQPAALKTLRNKAVSDKFKTALDKELNERH